MLPAFMHMYLLRFLLAGVCCECEWNNAERSWDCPCHGSRFSYEGDVLEGPATVPLAKLEADA